MFCFCFIFFQPFNTNQTEYSIWKFLCKVKKSIGIAGNQHLTIMTYINSRA